MCHNEVACITAGTAMVSAILAEAEQIAVHYQVLGITPEDELRVRLPLMLAQLSPGARALVREYLDHCAELVAGLHSALQAS